MANLLDEFKKLLDTYISKAYVITRMYTEQLRLSNYNRFVFLSDEHVNIERNRYPLFLKELYRKLMESGIDKYASLLDVETQLPDVDQTVDRLYNEITDFQNVYYKLFEDVGETEYLQSVESYMDNLTVYDFTYDSASLLQDLNTLYALANPINITCTDTVQAVTNLNEKIKEQIAYSNLITQLNNKVITRNLSKQQINALIDTHTDLSPYYYKFPTYFKFTFDNQTGTSTNEVTAKANDIVIIYINTHANIPNGNFECKYSITFNDSNKQVLGNPAYNNLYDINYVTVSRPFLINTDSTIHIIIEKTKANLQFRVLDIHASIQQNL
ncbi:hypothetical protein SDDV_ORF119 [Scale drop disease virus]|nr:hypothetical protein SDDV_ORF119 [Scale drop disease virus]